MGLPLLQQYFFKRLFRLILAVFSSGGKLLKHEKYVSGWQPWSNWSDCTKTCDNGERSRTRECLNGIVGQSICEGNDKEVYVCHNRPCNNGKYCKNITLRI